MIGLDINQIAIGDWLKFSRKTILHGLDLKKTMFCTYRNNQEHPRSQKSKKIAGNVTGRRGAYHIEK